MGFGASRIAQSPVWLGGLHGTAYQQAQGDVQDDEIALTKGAVRVRYPYPIGPLDALPAQSSERRILPAPGEDDEDFAARLTNAPELWYWAGTRLGLGCIFDPFSIDDSATPPVGRSIRLDTVQNAALISERRTRGEPTPEIIQAHDPPESRFAAFYSNVDWEGFFFGCDWSSLIYGIVDSREGPWGIAEDWDSGWLWDDGHLWDTTMTEAEARYIRRMIRRWKPVDGYPVAISIWLQGSGFEMLWNGGPLWDDGWLWDADDAEGFFLLIGHTWQELEWACPSVVQNWDGGWLWEAYIPTEAV